MKTDKNKKTKTKYKDFLKQAMKKRKSTESERTATQKQILKGKCIQPKHTQI